MNDDTGWWLDEYDGPKFWANVNKMGGNAHLSDPLANAKGECWVWLGGCQRDGYGQFRMGHKRIAAHRAAYLDAGPKNTIPEGHHLDHLCRNPKCVRPTHLEPVLPAENVARGAVPVANREVCRNGHAFTVQNIVVTHAGVRACRTCLRESKHRTYLRRKAEGKR